MPFTARDVFARTTPILQDAGAVRWPYPEQILWLNDAVREIALLKPNATAKTVELAMVRGALQTLPATAQRLMQVIRNLDTLAGSETGRAGGRAITPITRDLMDSLRPNWTDPNVLPYGKVVRHVIDDAYDERSFYVVPGNDGTGIIEAIVSAIPADLSAPVTAPDSLASYAALTVDLPDIYRSPVVDYVLYRAFSKDMNLPASAARASAHYQQFAAALGQKAQVEQIANVNQSGQPRT